MLIARYISSYYYDNTFIIRFIIINPTPALANKPKRTLKLSDIEKAIFASVL